MLQSKNVTHPSTGNVGIGDQMILWDGSKHDRLEGRAPRLCLMGATDDATAKLLPGADFPEQASTVGYLRVLRHILREKGIPHRF